MKIVRVALFALLVATVAACSSSDLTGPHSACPTMGSGNCTP